MKRLSTTITILGIVAAFFSLALIPAGCDPDKSELESKVGAFLKVEDYDRAFKLVNGFLQEHSDKPIGYDMLEKVITAGSAFLKSEDRKRAIKLVDGYIQEYPANPIGRAMMARVLAADGQTDNAFREYYRLYKLTETISPKLLAEIGRVSLNKSNDSGEVKSNESGGVGDKRDVPALIYSLNDSDYSVRESAVGALGRLGDKRAVPALIDALNDSDWYVRSHAVKVLGELGDKRAVPALINPLNDSDDLVRACVAEALGELEDRSVVPALIEIIGGDDSIELKFSVAEALVKLSQ